MPAYIPFVSQLVHEANVSMGNGHYMSANATLILCNSVSGGSFLWNETATLPEVILTEVPGAPRTSFSMNGARTITGINTTTNTITTSAAHDYTANQPVYIYSGARYFKALPFIAGKIYYVLNPSGTTFQLSEVSGGTVMSLPTLPSGALGDIYVCMAGTIDPTTRKITTPIISVPVTPLQNISYTDAVILYDATASWSRSTVNSVNTGGSWDIQAIARDLLNEDVIVVEKASADAYPTPTDSRNTLTDTAFKIHNYTVGYFTYNMQLTNPYTNTILTFSSLPGGNSSNFYIRNAKGQLGGFIREDTVAANALKTINAGNTKTFQFQREFSLIS